MCTKWLNNEHLNILCLKNYYLRKFVSTFTIIVFEQLPENIQFLRRRSHSTCVVLSYIQWLSLLHVCMYVICTCTSLIDCGPKECKHLGTKIHVGVYIRLIPCWPIGLLIINFTWWLEVFICNYLTQYIELGNLISQIAI